ncbi:peptidyl-prolyl cis-trans isomerase [Luteolibacter arcticus]|uniref:Peptidyl-prolyl cis-trans isomerase n=1 Tax=Luteolibacter arcticus TaxID=1581411 RepID=A0ABT3GNM5_9BACT|nr:peptidyl-prolyl cis-trans isomerase [Luteolibacter arcticus]MCW1925131.1 peptidyl-prolyl cis-trans isomerase [Luteolibacter arcticus]
MPRVNGEPIDPTLIEDTFIRLKAEAEMASEVSCCERDGEFRERAEEEVIDGILLAQEAERRVPEPPADETRTAFEDTLREWRRHGASWDLLDAQRESLRAETISRLRMERFTGGLWKELPELGYEDLRNWYGENLTRFRTPAAANVLHLVRFPESPDPWDDYAAMLDFRRRALEGEDFATLATAHTQKKGGETDLGWIEQQRLLNPFEAMLFSLHEGEVSPVFHYEQAYHLVKVTEARAASVQPFEEVADSIREEVERERRLQVLKDLAAKLRATAVIEQD